MPESEIHHPASGVRSPEFRFGFTMLELLIVVAVIGILVSILMPATQGLRQKAKEKERDATKDALAQAVRAFRTEYGYWPLSDLNETAATLTATNQVQYTVIKDYLLSNGSKNKNNRIFWEVDQVVTNVVTRKPFSITMDVANDTVTVN
jgi:prepilin-type N-terminal cleavage/methylation domain-containing protein